jgi:hypothetical protein
MQLCCAENSVSESGIRPLWTYKAAILQISNENMLRLDLWLSHRAFSELHGVTVQNAVIFILRCFIHLTHFNLGLIYYTCVEREPFLEKYLFSHVD